MQVGFILIFGIMMLGLTMYQANVVPTQNKNIEIKHSQEMKYEFSDIQSAIFNTGMTGSPRTKTFPMSLQYPTRLVAINPVQPAGQLSTSALRSITISNSSMSHTIPTRYLEYEVDYRLYNNNPIYTYETGFVYRNFENAQTSITPNQFILNNGFSIVALQGQYNETSYTDARIPVEQTSSLVKYTITNPEITVPTRLDEKHWQGFADERSNVNIEYDDTVGDKKVTITRNGEMELYLTSVSLSDDTDGGVNHDDINLPESQIDTTDPTDPTNPTDDPNKPPATDVYDIRTESYIGNTERIFEVRKGYSPDWTFGDGTTSTKFYQRYDYGAPGTYDITLDIIIDGSEYTYTDTVTIYPDVTLDYRQAGNSANTFFSWSTTPTVSGASITFVDDGTIVESGLSQDKADYKYTSSDSGDVIQIKLIDDSTGDVIDTQSITIN